MSRRKNPHKTTIKPQNVQGKRMHKLTCTCGYFQYTSKGKAQQLEARHLSKMEEAGEAVARR